MANGIIELPGGGLKPDEVRAWAKYTIASSAKGDFIEIVYGKVGDYPNDGSQGGYWYTLIQNNLFGDPRIKSIQFRFSKLSSSGEINIDPVNPDCSVAVTYGPYVVVNQGYSYDGIEFISETIIGIEDHTSTRAHVLIIEFYPECVKSVQSGIVNVESGKTTTISISPVNLSKIIPSFYRGGTRNSLPYQWLMSLETITSNSMTFGNNSSTNSASGKWRLLELK